MMRLDGVHGVRCALTVSTAPAVVGGSLFLVLFIFLKNKSRQKPAENYLIFSKMDRRNSLKQLDITFYSYRDPYLMFFKINLFNFFVPTFETPPASDGCTGTKARTFCRVYLAIS